jgi:hypothetical protein
VLSNNLRAKAGSLDDLQTRFLGLRTQNDVFTEWCALDGTGFAPVIDRRPMMKDAKAVACRLYEQRCMIEEDYLSKRADRLGHRLTPCQLCEKLGHELHDSEQELQCTLWDEECLQELVNSEQTRRICKEGRDIIAKRVVQIRSLHQKLRFLQDRDRT